MTDYTRCAHHDTHQTRLVRRILSDHKLLDVPSIRADLDLTLDLTIYDWPKYSDDTFSTYDFCPAQDVVSYCIDVQGIWEGMETLAVLDILRHPGLVVDVGCQIGWYAALSVAMGHEVIGVEASSESAAIALQNAKANGHGTPGAYCEVRTGMVHNLYPLTAWPIRLFISDVEGAEAAAIEYCVASFAERLVDFAMLEMSPVFNDTYPALTQQLLDWGYLGFQVPHKGERLDDYGSDPLGVLLSQRPITPEIVAGWRQESAVFVSSDVFALLT